MDRNISLVAATNERGEVGVVLEEERSLQHDDMLLVSGYTPGTWILVDEAAVGEVDEREWTPAMRLLALYAFGRGVLRTLEDDDGEQAHWRHLPVLVLQQSGGGYVGRTHSLSNELKVELAKHEREWEPHFFALMHKMGNDAGTALRKTRLAQREPVGV